MLCDPRETCCGPLAQSLNSSCRTQGCLCATVSHPDQEPQAPLQMGRRRGPWALITGGQKGGADPRAEAHVSFLVPREVGSLGHRVTRLWREEAAEAREAEASPVPCAPAAGEKSWLQFQGCGTLLCTPPGRAGDGRKCTHACTHTCTHARACRGADRRGRCQKTQSSK